MPTKEESTPNRNNPSLSKVQKQMSTTQKKKRFIQSGSKKPRTTGKKRDRVKKTKDKQQEKNSRAQKDALTPTVLSKAHSSKSPNLSTPRNLDIRQFCKGSQKPKSDSKGVEETKDDEKMAALSPSAATISPSKDKEDGMIIKEEWNGNILGEAITPS